MKLTTSCIFLILLITSGFCDDAFTTSSPTETTNTSAETVTTTTDSTTQSTSQQPDTTPSTTTNLPTTSSTEPPTTTTTIKPTTTSQPDTTTPSPSPTTLPPSTTTKSPKPPTPAEGSWNVTEGNLTCIRADLEIRFQIIVQDRVEYIALSPNATSSGNCKLSDTTQELELEDSNYKLTMIFEKDSTNAYLRNITFNYNLPDGSGLVYNDTKLFSVKIGNSYMCDSSNDVIFRNVTMEVLRIRIQAFGSIGNKDFGIAEKCEADNTVNDMVPIAVGIALLVLVVVVLIAYFVGRRRSRQKGYQSV
ncbi:Lysosome-associated membrane glycoprotein 1 like protein [Argiope bruennichi]|uniref:Lysosome-associated membrane glycoprotein 5 n=1 Tax=Argiope bruennichi TaxID=94029 RepID=A0A8T0FMG7_ARGBR|nr:Lysosome-associated membrane glycoprotein 1 like protein [Argiope bruennichi]